MRSWAWGLLLLPLGLQASERIDPERSSAKIAVSMRWLQVLDCRLRDFEGELGTLPDGLLRQVTVRLDVRTLDIEGSARFTRWAKSEEFLDIERYPWVVFSSVPLMPAMLHSGGVLACELFLRCVVRQVRFELQPSSCDRPGFDCAIRVSGAVSRHDFGMITRPLAVRDKVKIAFSVMLQEPEP